MWHAGDIGDALVLEGLSAFKEVRAVYGNIDDWKMRSMLPRVQRFKCEDVNVLMMHIGGYPGRYQPELKAMLKEEPADLVVCGHSHILKVMFDKHHNCLFINPGAIGKHGFHQVRTAIRMEIDGDKIKHLEVLELER